VDADEPKAWNHKVTYSELEILIKWVAIVGGNNRDGVLVKLRGLG
jgi:hypothetical protein